TPTPTPTPLGGADDRYALIMDTFSAASPAQVLSTLGSVWYLDYSANTANIPAGRQKLIGILSLPGPSFASIQAIAQQYPGAVWYVLGEPNRIPEYFDPPAVVSQLHDLYVMIKAADSTAKISSPSVLNWDFTCNGCGGYKSGHTWVDQFRTAYRAIYGQEPPIDVWAIDVYPLDWFNLPTIDTSIPINQLTAMRQYLNNVPQFASKPIWVTELGLHWGWTDFRQRGDTTIPCGTYKTGQVIAYFRTVFDWLEANASSLNIPKWFTFIAYEDLTGGNPAAYAGASMYTSPPPGGALSPFGQFFRNRVFHTNNPLPALTEPSIACP
ncbi:MAG: hypothetical protein HY261_05325, partial [Chloroflexi bacterium]|nr:hypothetical protein [Chloroflexota bacterium]